MHKDAESELQSWDSNPDPQLSTSTQELNLATVLRCGRILLLNTAQPLCRPFSIHRKPSSLQKGAFEMQRLTALFMDPHCGFWLELAGHQLCGSQSFKKWCNIPTVFVG